jgi:putative transposase
MRDTGGAERCGKAGSDHASSIATYALRCYRYIELSPVRARMVELVADHPRSSDRTNALGREDAQVTHAGYVALAGDPQLRAAAYCAPVDQAMPDEQVAEIRAYLQQGRAWGGLGFHRRVQQQSQRYAAVRPAHRSRKPL